ncbi:hypothetical protein ACFODZ_15900 [Marinicella sediminis]|uniref:Uncharacterized protein n=1 Tax=Marinicella sediminis TaxID=1792834 RepID=A0ABV7JC88_9GAMM|nr:hypothetical protein [Marinicella sediminis]
MSDYPTFSEEAVQHAIQAAKDHYDSGALKSRASNVASDDGHLALLAECISVSVKNGKACLNLPLGIGSVCIPVPIKYDGQVVQACLHICTTFGFPTGVRVTISVAGVTIVSKSFGKC